MCDFKIIRNSMFPFYVNKTGDKMLLSVDNTKESLEDRGYVFGGYKYKEYCKDCAKMVDIYRQRENDPWICPECFNESIVQYGDTCPKCEVGVISADESRNVHFYMG